MKILIASILLLFAAGSALAQDAPADMHASLTPAEERISALIQQDGIHVVHFWAPWCDNSIAELRNGWYDVVERHEDVSFTFVTIWNDDESGRGTMERYAIPARVLELTQADHGPSGDKPNRRRTFMNLPVTWIPTTWVFHKNGQLAYAFNYGELEMAQLEKAIADTRSEWKH
jgi:hypothetical protein